MMRLGVGTSMVIPSGASTGTECEYPTWSSSFDGPWAVGDAPVEGRPQDGDVEVCDLVDAR